jgi:hypothetical protein
MASITINNVGGFIKNISKNKDLRALFRLIGFVNGSSFILVTLKERG